MRPLSKPATDVDFWKWTSVSVATGDTVVALPKPPVCPFKSALQSFRATDWYVAVSPEAVVTRKSAPLRNPACRRAERQPFGLTTR